MRIIPNSVFFRWFMLFTVLFVTGCNPTTSYSEKKIAPDTVQDIMNNVNSSYYSLRANGINRLTFFCVSDAFRYAVTQVKDGRSQEQLERVRFLVDWESKRPFEIEITNVPKPLGGGVDEKLMSVLKDTREGIRAALFAASFVFYGVNPVGNPAPTYLESKDKKIFIFTDKRGFEEKYYFDHDYSLLGIEVIQGSSVLTKIDFNFEKREKGEKYLKKVTVSRPSSDFFATYNIEYQKNNGTYLPSKISGGPIISGKDRQDKILISYVNIN